MAQPLLGIDGSGAMALSMIAIIPDLAHIYIESLETATSNLHASALAYSPQDAPILYSQMLSFQEAHLRSATTGH